MKTVARIQGLLRKIYRTMGQHLLLRLQAMGHNDLRQSFLEILIFLCEHDGPTIKEIGKSCGLKKQTMTSHLNELERRGYIVRKSGMVDKREQNVFLTDYGQKFKLNLTQAMTELDSLYTDRVGTIELERISYQLEKFHKDTATQAILEN